jgi:hypothetical protein
MVTSGWDLHPGETFEGETEPRKVALEEGPDCTGQRSR